MCELRLSKQLFKNKLESLLSQEKYSKYDLVEQIISLLLSKDKEDLMQGVLMLSNNNELEELMEKVKVIDGDYKII